MSKTINNEEYGKFFGYPKCCIDAFGEVAMFFFKRPKIVQQATINGFVPCEKHAKQLIAGDISYGELINGARICSIPFKVTNFTLAEERIKRSEGEAYINSVLVT